MSGHWSERVVQILQSHSGDLKVLAEIGGCDWRQVYAGQSLRGCDLTRQDLRGMNLVGCEIDQAKIDDQTVIDPEFDPRTHEASRHCSFNFSSSLDSRVRSYAKRSSYRYIAWAYKSLFDYAFYGPNKEQLGDLIGSIKNHPVLGGMAKDNAQGRRIRRKFLVDRNVIDLMDLVDRNDNFYYAPSVVALIGLVWDTLLSDGFRDVGEAMEKIVAGDSVAQLPLFD